MSPDVLRADLLAFLQQGLCLQPITKLIQTMPVDKTRSQKNRQTHNYHAHDFW